MNLLQKRVVLYLAGTALAFLVAVPATAVDLNGISIGNGDRALEVSAGGISASIGTGNGLDANVSADLGAVDAGVNANLGGNGKVAGVDARASVGDAASARSQTSIGGSNLIDSTTTASVGGRNGLSAGAGVSVGDKGVNGKVELGLGNPVKGGTGNGGAGNGGGGNGVAQRAVRNLSSEQIAVFRKRCIGILSSPAAWDRDIVQMCRLLSQAASR